MKDESSRSNGGEENMSLVLSEKLLITEPEEIAKKKCPSDTQIRKFYDDFMLLKQKSDNIYASGKKETDKEDEFKNQILPLIKFEKVKMAYSVGRSGKPEYYTFFKEVTEKLSHIENRSDFELFLKFYEAIIAFVKFKSFEESISKQNNKNSNDKKERRYGN